MHYEAYTGLTSGTTRRGAIKSVAGVLGTLTFGSMKALADTNEEISHSAEAIHQVVAFNASPKRIYEALTNAKQFDKIIELSGVKQSMHLGDKTAEISGKAGDAFSLFGGYIVGRNIELVPNERIVQAWRAGNWNPGVYSIASFQLIAQGPGTSLVFDHTGFPKGDAESLASGWRAHYWEPLTKLLAQ